MTEVNKARGACLWRCSGELAERVDRVFGEDPAALLGLLIALIAVVATFVTGNPLFDAYGSICIGALLCIIAFFVAREVASLLVGKSAEKYLRDSIRTFVGEQQEVEQVFNLITLQLGPYLMVATKAKMRGEQSDREMIDAINRVEAKMKIQFPEIRWSFFEPDVED